MLTYKDFEADVKKYLRIAPHVTVYDDELAALASSAIASLKVAGVQIVKSSLVTEYINTYVRVRMMHDASEAFRASEFERENVLLRQLTYGEQYVEDVPLTDLKELEKALQLLQQRIDELEQTPGPKGDPGKNGKSAYELAVINGFRGSERDWLASLKGADGAPGQPGADGQDGQPGANGKSAFDLAVDNGFVGSSAEWLASLKGEPGEAPDLSIYPTIEYVDNKLPVKTGPGRPDKPETTGGVIDGTEADFTTYNSTDGAGVGANIWQKINGTWSVIRGDTGWRRINSSLLLSGYVAIRRVNNRCYVTMTGGRWGTVTLPVTSIADRVPRIKVLTAGGIPPGFQSGLSLMAPMAYDSMVQDGFMYIGGTNDSNVLFVNGYRDISKSNGEVMRAPLMIFVTSQAWPEVLPGSALAI